MGRMRRGQYARVDGSWGYVFAIMGRKVGLSGWRGVKTHVVRRTDIERVADKCRTCTLPAGVDAIDSIRGADPGTCYVCGTPL